MWYLCTSVNVAGRVTAYLTSNNIKYYDASIYNGYIHMSSISALYYVINIDDIDATALSLYLLNPYLTLLNDIEICTNGFTSYKLSDNQYNELQERASYLIC